MASPAKSFNAQHARFDSPEQEVFLHLWRTYDCLKAVEEQLFSQHDLSPQQYNALRLLQQVAPDGMQTMELGRRLISRAPDTTRMLDRLEKRGLIQRTRRAENRRVVEIGLTDHGHALLTQLAEAVLAMHQQQLGHLDTNQRHQLIELLKVARRPHEDASCDWLDDGT
ncbi:Transcriptional regulator SlyA [Rosistilla carotiformis]|uniref:Transcriptional regulator SlyA n=1 Tax=Rosistilla carotiformis TaxID=2528017 RepID=A0A518JTN3_9BACT|nr:MarR family transcriptional regulator [Rosistilla carotiformis]QDV68911.1 Transcriptional regulator SlyA [Rosistilla carotiformis]